MLKVLAVASLRLAEKSMIRRTKSETASNVEKDWMIGMFWKKRVYCGDVSRSYDGRQVLLMGFVDAIRDHGNLLFIHLRDIHGTVQVVFDPGVSGESYSKSATLKEEYVIRVRGKVCLREPGTENPNIATGEVEVFAQEMEILSRSKSLPFQISEKAMIFGENIKEGQVDEELRLQYRYLDLRRPSMQELFIKRYRIMKCIREYMDQLSFLEIETPILTKSTPEGARDYLVPSRIHRGKFYSLPQSPQLFKQILMMSGMDRYFQIVRCFRDEDLRPNRQPEFTQLDLEASFIDEEFIYEVLEELTSRIFAVGGISLDRPFPRMTYDAAIERYGSDRPDVRFGMAFQDLTDVFKETQYGIFRQIINQGGSVKGFCVKGKAALLSKNVLQNEYAMEIAPSFGVRGMTWMKVVNGDLESNVVQFFTGSEQSLLRSRFEASDGDVLIMIADSSRDLVNKVLFSLRLHMAERLGVIPQGQYRPLWVTDFPLFELKDGKLSSQHHPFTMPDRTDFDPMNKGEMLTLKSRAYDLVMNGEELGGGSIRIHQMQIQKKIFEALELTEDEIEAKFGFFLRALEYGAPPHGGLALGLDRVVAMILKVPSIREVIAFPKNRSAYCPLTQAPSWVEDSQLDELGLLNPAVDSRAQKAKHRAKAHGETPGPSKGVGVNQLKHIARLARLRMTEEESLSYRKDLNDILAYVETIEELDTEAVEPMSHVLEIKNVWREDKQGKQGGQESILSNAPSRDGDYYKVPRIIEE